MPVLTEEKTDRAHLEELVTWVKTLKEVGVSPDKAVEVAQKYLLHDCSDWGDEEDFDCEEGED